MQFTISALVFSCFRRWLFVMRLAIFFAFMSMGMSSALAFSCNVLYGSYAATSPANGPFTIRSINAGNAVSAVVTTPSLNDSRGNAGAVTPNGQRYYYRVNTGNGLYFYDQPSNTIVNTGQSLNASHYRMAIESTGIYGYVSSIGVAAFQRFLVASPYTVENMTLVDVAPAGLEYSGRPGGDIAFDANGVAYSVTRKDSDGSSDDFLSYLYRLDFSGLTVTATYLGQITSNNSAYSTFDANGIGFIGTTLYIGGGATLSGNNSQLWSVNISSLIATLVGTEAGGVPITDLASCSYPTLSASLISTKTVSDLNGGMAVPGDTLEYTILVGNRGQLPSGNSTLTDFIPIGTTYVPASTRLNGVAIADDPGPTMPYVNGSPVNSPSQLAGVLLADTSTIYDASLSFRVTINTVLPVNTVTNQGTFTFTGGNSPVLTDGDPATVGTQPTIITVPSIASLSVTKTNGVNSLVAGQTVNYTVTFANAGPFPADNAIVKDIPSVGLSNCAATSCTGAGGATCPVPTSSVFTVGGGTLTTFPANSTVTMVVSCGVTALGL
jgi:uncharacterized repeat protein (TIGR01451 family)